MYKDQMFLWLKDLTSWDFFITISYKPSSYTCTFKKNLFNDVQTANRFLAKCFKSQSSYIAIVVKHSNIIHLHMLVSLKKSYLFDEDKFKHTLNFLPFKRYEKHQDRYELFNNLYYLDRSYFVRKNTYNNKFFHSIKIEKIYDVEGVIKYICRDNHFHKSFSNIDPLPVNKQVKVNKLLNLNSISESNPTRFDLLDFFISSKLKKQLQIV